VFFWKEILEGEKEIRRIKEWN